METKRGQLEVIDVPERCGNAPRKAVIRDFVIDLYSGHVPEATALLTEDVQWERAGGDVLDGVQKVEAWLSTVSLPRELHIKTVLTHGIDCGVDGVVTYPDGTKERFSHILIFTGGAKTARIKEVRSYSS